MEHGKGYGSKGINEAAFQNLNSRHKMYFPVLSWNTHPVLGEKRLLKPPRKGRKPDSVFILEQKVTRVLSGLKIGFCP